MAENSDQEVPRQKAPPPPELEKFVFESDRFTSEVVPRKLDPAAVAEFLIDRIDEKTPLKPLRQAEKAAAFYDTHEITARYRELLKALEPTEDILQKRIVVVRTIARVGGPEDVEFARQDYEQIAPQVRSVPDFNEAIALHDVLGVGNRSQTLRRALEARLSALAPQRETDDSARLEYLELQETVRQKLDDADAAAAQKARILEIADRKQRIAEEIKVYLAVDYGYIEFLQPWSAARLRRETWAAQPPEQVVREVKPELQADVAQAFQQFLGGVDRLPDMDDEDREAAKVQVLRAIKFFDGGISEQDEIFLQQFRGTQADTLANEGFLLP